MGRVENPGPTRTEQGVLHSPRDGLQAVSDERHSDAVHLLPC